MFDKGYNHYEGLDHFTKKKTGVVSRIKDNASFREIKRLDIIGRIHNGDLKVEVTKVDVKNSKEITRIKLRKVIFYDWASKREF